MRRRTSTGRSLDLLLDTICNTFGGVLFLAMLVCILLHSTGHSSSRQERGPQFTEADVLELMRQQQELESALERLRAGAAQQDRLAAEYIKSEARYLHDLLVQSREVRDSLDDERRKVLADIAAKQAKVAAIEKELADLGQHLSDARKIALEAQIALKAEIASRSVTANLPREHVSLKPQIGFVVRYGRLYQWLRYDRFGRSEGLNTDEFVVVAEEGDRLETRPKPHAGTPIGNSAIGQMKARFRQFDPHETCLAIAVWDDSFDVFQNVKAAAVSAGFEYRLILMREGNSLADRGGSDSRVQ